MSASTSYSRPGGLSPRGRGNPGLADRRRVDGGSIPAWAGQPSFVNFIRNLRTVYPRVGGATQHTKQGVPHIHGLSPRGRGNPPQRSHRFRRRRSIPAWAGQPERPWPTAPSTPVYPRVGGATHPARRHSTFVMGLSPRGRGNPGDQAERKRQRRSIPAWAGQPPTPEPTPLLQLGLSPRGRGNRGAALGCPATQRSIPAWAGQPIVSQPIHESTKVYPRVGGATSYSLSGTGSANGLSPRGRGNHNHGVRFRLALRSIPAWAGQPIIPRPSRERWTVYPRVGGATSRLSPRRRRRWGLSPRGRGNLSGVRKGARTPGSIPAWAGQPKT